jgi:hypothetical protein
VLELFCAPIGAGSAPWGLPGRPLPQRSDSDGPVLSWLLPGGRVSPAGDRGDAGRGGRGRGGDRGRGPPGAGRGGARFGTRADSGEVAENGYDAGMFQGPTS